MMKTFLIIVIVIFSSSIVYSQEKDTTQTAESITGPSQQFQVDSLVVREKSPTDISDDRGLYIVTSDGKMQLRILGSVRFGALYDIVELPIKKYFNTYYIPTGDDNVKIPNYYNSLNETRFGFEVTRKLETQDVFIRLETDFNGGDGQFRIRHAYGQVDNFLVGQTWSLFSNVSSMPTMVDGKGPTGSVTLRTPQIRYGGTNGGGVRWAAALEYSKPDINIEDYDTSGISTVHMIPDFTGRLVWEGILGIVQLSGVVNVLTKKDANNKVSSSFGFGASLSGTVKFPSDHNLLYQFTYGKSISHFITTFRGTGSDAAYNPETNNFEGLISFGGFLSYGVEWRILDLNAHLSVGYAKLFDEEFLPDDYYSNSISISLDSFWMLGEGTRLGVEYVYGQRWDKNNETGQASRISSLFYYDF
jgi:hypothetical protein